MTKNKFNNWLEAQAVLDWGDYMLRQIAGKKRTPIEIMIHEATWYDEENKNRVIEILEDMIDAAKYLWLEAAIERLEKLLKNIKEIKKVW